MRKASVSLLSNIINLPRFRAISPLLSRSRNCVSGDNALPFSPLHSTGRCLHSSSRTHGFILKSNPFQSNPSRNLSTLAEILSAKEAFEHAKTAEELVAAYKVLEPHFDGKEVLGLASFRVASQLDHEGKDLEKALSFADKALQALDQDGKPSLLVARVLGLIARVTISLERFDDGLEYLNRAKIMLYSLWGMGVAVEDIRPVLHVVQLGLGAVKIEMGRKEEAFEDLKKALAIRDLLPDKDKNELGVSYRALALDYVSVSKLKEALHCGLKALEIHKEELGPNSVEVAHDRHVLGKIYTDMEEYEKALEQFELARKVNAKKYY